MNAPGRQGQIRRQVSDVPARQLVTWLLTTGLTDGQPRQSRWGISFIPGEKLRALAQQVTPRRKMVFFPEAADPQSVDSFDVVIALWFTGRNEQQFDA